MTSIHSAAPALCNIAWGGFEELFRDTCDETFAGSFLTAIPVDVLPCRHGRSRAFAGFIATGDPKWTAKLITSFVDYFIPLCLVVGIELGPWL